MAFFRYTFTFTQFNQQWSEIWYGQAADLQTASVIPPANLVPFMGPLNTSVQLLKIRVNDVALNRSSTVVTPAGVFGLNNESSPDITGATALINFSAPSVKSSRKVWLRGLSDASIQRNQNSGIAIPSPVLRASINSYITNILNFPFLVQANAKVAVPPVAPNVWTNLSTINGTSGQGQVSLACPAGAVPAAYSFVTLTRTDPKQWPGLRGIFQVQSVGAASFTVNYEPAQSVVNVTLKGRWRPINYQYGGIDDDASGFQGFTTRKTGKNTQGGRGARSPQRLRLAQ
jgi:hypothetical protein